MTTLIEWLRKDTDRSHFKKCGEAADEIERQNRLLGRVLEMLDRQFRHHNHEPLTIKCWGCMLRKEIRDSEASDGQEEAEAGGSDL